MPNCAGDSPALTESLPDIRQERESDLSTRRGQVRWLAAELNLAPSEANRLVRAYLLDQRDAEAREASREEFRAWFTRRGDLLLVRGKANHAWRVTS